MNADTCTDKLSQTADVFSYQATFSWKSLRGWGFIIDHNCLFNKTFSLLEIYTLGLNFSQYLFNAIKKYASPGVNF